MDSPQQLVEHGTSDGLRFRLRWLDSEDARTAADATRGELTLWLADAVVWGAEESGETCGLDWAWIELLEHLARSWRYLEWEEGNPLGLAAYPGALRTLAEERWRDLPAARRDQEEPRLYEFEESHDLAAGVQGMHVPSVWIQREGTRAHVMANGSAASRPLSEVLDTLDRLGDAVCTRVMHRPTDERGLAAAEAWRQRRSMAPATFVAVSTGLPADVLRDLSGSRDVAQAWELGKELEQTEVLAAARMVGRILPRETVNVVLDQVRRLPRQVTAALDHLTELVEQELAGMDQQPPHDQGTTVARWLRDKLGISPDQRAEPAKILKNWGVVVRELDLGASSVDAVGCWGPLHGPAVLVNPEGRHTQGKAGRRATLAHEICHLLCDRPGALPLAEVAGGQLPPDVEPRARAFAAELLVPQAAVASLVGEDRFERAIKRASKRFGASLEVVAWQVRNSGVQLEPKETSYLRSVVSNPSQF